MALTASMRMSFSGRSSIGSSFGNTSVLPRRPSARSAAGTERGSPVEHFEQGRCGLGAADLGQRIGGAFAHPPVVVAGGADQVVDGALVLGLVEDLDGGAADVVVLVADQVQDGVHDLRSADLGQRVGGARTYPPVAIFQRDQQVLDGVGFGDLVEHFDGRAAGELGLVLEHVHQVLHGVGVPQLDHQVDGAGLHFEFRVGEQRADQADVAVAGHGGQCFERGLAHHLVAILQLALQGLGDIRPVEAAQQFDDVQTYRGILAFDAGNQVGNEFGRGDIGEDAEYRRLFLRLQVIGAAQQFARVDAPA